MSITLKDIAQQAGVSQMTVSRILNGKTQGQVSEEVISRVRSIASELKYRSNRTDRKLNCLLNRDAQDAELPKVTVLTPAPDFLEMPGRSARILNEVLPGIFRRRRKPAEWWRSCRFPKRTIRIKSNGRG